MAYEVGYFTFLLLAINVAISFWAFSWMKKGGDPDRFLFSPYSLARGKNWDGALMSQFAHADVGHLVFNMLTLYFFGPAVEAHLGKHIFTIYILSGLAALLTVFVIRRNDPHHRVLGASGSITGILFASIVLQPGMSVFFFFIPIPIPGPVFAVIYLIASTYLMSRSDMTRVSHEAHVGGAIAGFLLAGWLAPQGFHALVARILDLFGR